MGGGSELGLDHPLAKGTAGYAASGNFAFWGWARDFRLSPKATALLATFVLVELDFVLKIASWREIPALFSP